MVSQIINIFLAVFCFISLLALWEVDFWWIRIFDFPRLQIAVLTVIFVCLRLVIGLKYQWDWIVLVLLAISLAVDFYRIIPYTRLVGTEVSKIRGSELDSISVKIVSLNVKQKNRAHSRVLDMLTEVSPSVVMLLETDEIWQRNLKSLKQQYPYTVEVPQDNTYGILFFSKLPIINHQVKNLVDEKVPSLFVTLDLGDSRSMELIGLHPRPPRPAEGHSTQRDGELSIVAKHMRDNKDRPIIVIGDFNDVAWSHTTRLFKRVSGALDPRVGRGLFSTFPVNYPLFRFPLDHTFFSKQIGLVEIQRLGDVGSDHFPMFLEIGLLQSPIDRPTEHADQEDLKENKEMIEAGDDWEPPKKEVKD